VSVAGSPCWHIPLALDPVFLDTETTGLDAGAQALEIGLVNARGERIFETRLKPTVGIDPTAAAVHGSGLLKWEAMPDWAGQSPYLVNRYSERKESAEELSRRVIRAKFEGWYE
jgi:hypothetical protein